MRDFAKGGAEGWLQLRAAEVCLAVALSPAFAWMAPFGTDEGSFLERLAFWGGLLASWFVLLALTETRLRGVRLFAPLSPAVRRIAFIACAAFPMILIAGAALESRGGWEASVAEVSELYVQIIVIGSGATLLAKAVLPQPSPLVAPGWPAVPSTDADGVPAPAPVAPVAPLIARLPPAVRGAILCLEMEDHYVRVHTAKGSALVLLRLSDAIAETSPTPGRQVHRSWWVSDVAVEGVEKRGRVAVARLSNGLQVPVSQRYLKDAQAIPAKADPAGG